MISNKLKNIKFVSMKYEELLNFAKQASKNAYAPYSKFPVGACVLTENEKIYTGCNFENSSFGLTICAERNAVGSAINDGEKVFEQSQYFHQTKTIALHAVLAGRCLMSLKVKKVWTL